MANYANLEAFIQSKVYENANNEITGQGLQDTLLEMVKELGKSGYICQGVATTSTTPPVSSDSNIFYFAEGAGTYTNFGGLVVGVGELALFFWNGSTWDKESCNIVEIIDNLTTNDSTKALSAKQGKVLNDALQAIRQTLASMDILDNVAGSAVGLLNPIAENAEFAFQKSGSKGDGALLINAIKGKSFTWNQRIKNGNFADGINNWSVYDSGVSSISVSDSVLTQNIVSVADASYKQGLLQIGVSNPSHTYLFSAIVESSVASNFNVELGGSSIGSASLAAGVKTNISFIGNAASYNDQFLIYPILLSVFTIKYYSICLIDLTLLGIDDLTTVEEVEAWLATNVGLRSYYPFNAGELKSNDAQSIVTVGRNQWDEEWEVGMYNVSSGEKEGGSSIRNKNLIPILPNTTYYKKCPNPGIFWNLFYDSDKKYIGYDASNYNSEFTTPANAHYLAFYTEYGYGTTYNHDICINLSDASFNGQYEPYWKNTLELNIKTLTGKKDGQGASVTIFPDGAAGVGSVYDELRKSVAYKRCGIRAYQAGDESDSSVITDGTNTIYVLATPETYVLDTPLKMAYRVAKGGTEERVSPNADGISAPMVEEVQYPMQTKGDAGYEINVQDGNPATIKLTLPIDATGAVFLTCGGATFSALVSAGQATLSISGIASGTYTFVAMYSGDGKYAPFSVSDTVTIS